MLLQQSSCCCLFAARLSDGNNVIRLFSPTAWRRLKVYAGAASSGNKLIQLLCKRSYSDGTTSVFVKGSSGGELSSQKYIPPAFSYRERYRAGWHT